MTVIQLMQLLDELVQANPEAAKFPVIRGTENEGYELIKESPTRARVANFDDTPIELEDLDSDPDCNVVVIS
ncbi:MAG: hypothetical protein ABJH04_07665 [Cyclobacteriaceae bacterium]